MTSDFNAELHARPSIYFTGPAFVEHIALMQSAHAALHGSRYLPEADDNDDPRLQVEHHTEFITITRVTQLTADAEEWPVSSLSVDDIASLVDIEAPLIVSRVGILVLGPAPAELGPILSRFGFHDTAASFIGGGAAQVCSDFRVQEDQASRILLFNKELNAYRLGRMVRRIYEIETYRSMALLGLPEARRLAPLLGGYDKNLVELTNRNQTTATTEHKKLLEEISELSAQIISAAASTRNRFGATAAYAKIVEERIGELRESHVPGFQRFGVFVTRRFRPAIRTCEATALRLDQLSHATMHLIDLLQTRIQVEIEYQNAIQIQAMADRAATQVKIQRAVEGLSIIAISYYLLSLLKVAFETADHAGYHISPLVMLVSIPVVIGAVALAILRVKHALSAHA
ncbi:DUF3422 domain-containing protein [Rhizobium jaguaris]|uniref:DUF3422 family protein n=1 Tax=Rhizobium jaguaris TaxID=1312183 RepID=A0A387G4R8_9HYPH|nr:DUF3422 domain-containing protein [Rhizobium jaguaris]AYG63274.1 DUF3422 family protein [Rhizobium jaguaris]